MKKWDLKNGQVVKTRDGVLRLVWGNNLVSANDYNGGLSLNGFNDNLLYNNFDFAKYFNVEEVYSIPEGELSAGMDFWLNEGYILDKVTLLWQRTEKVELTLNQIANKFNVPVEQLRIKEK